MMDKNEFRPVKMINNPKNIKILNEIRLSFLVKNISYLSKMQKHLRIWHPCIVILKVVVYLKILIIVEDSK
jgi:hypothetical protein